MVVDLKLVSRLLSPAVLWLGILAVIPALLSFFTSTDGWWEFLATAGASIFVSFFCRRIGKRAGSQTGIRELFVFTGLLWCVMTSLAAIPFYLILKDLSIAESIFESASGLSTTGATVIDNLDSRPPAVLLWRSMLQFLGGIGFVVIAVAILPNASLGGMNIFKTESTSFDDSLKITPHVKTMAISLLAWYMLMLFLCIFFYILGGFDIFLAVNAALCTVSTGGMMPIDASMNGASAFIQYTCMVFMFLGSCPFLLILGSITGSITTIIKDQQVKCLFFTIIIISLMIGSSLIIINGYGVEAAYRTAFFNVIAILSSTGFNLGDFTEWNSFATIIFLMILGVGGCSGSTSGGIKLFRLQICYSMFKAQVRKSIHPHQVIEPRFNGQVIDSATLRSVITYLVSYMLIAMLSAIFASLLGLSLSDAITGTVSALSNIGPAIGPTLGPSHSFAGLSDSIYCLFAFDMILGRLEILPLLLCLTPMFWKR